MDIEEFNIPLDELMPFLQTPLVIEQTKIFLRQNGTNIFVKKFLSFFMIYYHKDEILDDHEISIEFYKQVKRCIRVYNSLREEYKEFKIKIFQYTVNETEKWFDIWKKKDKYEIIMPMIHMYHYLEEHKTQQVEWNQEIDRQKALIRSNILNLESTAQELLDNPPRVQINEEAQRNVMNVVYQAYWDKFQKSVEDKDWSQLIGFVEEIKTMLKDLVPHRNDLHLRINNELDVEKLRHKLENNIMSNDDIYETMGFVVHWIEQFQTPSDDKNTEEWWEHLKTQETWGILMRDFFMITFAKLDKIRVILNKINKIYKK